MGFIIVALSICIIKPILGFLVGEHQDFPAERVGSYYLGVSFELYSLMFLWLSYMVLHNDTNFSNIFLIGGILGYIVIMIVLVYYRFNVAIGKFKNRSGAPNYKIIGIMTIVGGFALNYFTDNMGQGVNAILITFGTLVISYIFSIGGVLLIEHIFSLN
ncbi:hypothetical protein [Aminipila terrae]|uniref:Uncharacterized protein n=1 Tax=Aminipila terrae TaxID=2697030 RepID=A0A6P1MMZ1_9FIRM|nr:hypothetical protein [Aminipila terrae]QHI73458.1 hypothetical protein Ami3637_14695 [Aminipila terrae]